MGCILYLKSQSVVMYAARLSNVFTIQLIVLVEKYFTTLRVDH